MLRKWFEPFFPGFAQPFVKNILGPVKKAADVRRSTANELQARKRVYATAGAGGAMMCFAFGRPMKK